MDILGCIPRLAQLATAALLRAESVGIRIAQQSARSHNSTRFRIGRRLRGTWNQVKNSVEEAMENNLGEEVAERRWIRWDTCCLCEQEYHGVVRCALGWACWKTYVGWPETDAPRRLAITVLGNGLDSANHHEDALSVKESELSIERRLEASEVSILAAQNNLANSYYTLKRFEEALRLRQNVYSGHLKLNGEQHRHTLGAANNYASSLLDLQRFKETKALLLKVMPVARRVLGESNEITLRLRWSYAQSLYEDPGATVDDLKEAMTTLEDAGYIALHVFGDIHPLAVAFAKVWHRARDTLAAREGDDVSSVCDGVAAMTAKGA